MTHDRMNILHSDTLQVTAAGIGYAITANLPSIDLWVKVAGGLLFIAFTGYKFYKEIKSK